MAEKDAFKIRCLSCKAKNRVPPQKAGLPAKCGRCGQPLDTQAVLLPQPMMFTDADFESKVLRSPLPALVFFWAPWCPTCRAMFPVIDEFAAAAKGRIRVGKLNVDQSPQTAGRYDIMSVPNTLVFDNGRLVESLVGQMGKHDLMMKMARYL